MAQSDLNVANADGATVRADINSQLEALATSNSGSTAPPVVFPYMRWFDTANSLLMERNGANTAWRTVAAVVAGELVPYSAGESADERYAPYETYQNIAVFGTAGVTEWTVPDVLRLGLRKAHVEVRGGGGSGARADRVSTGPGGGGGGGIASGLVDLTGVESVTVTVGVGGPSRVSTGDGFSGDSSSFGSYGSASGGAGGVEVGGGGMSGAGTGLTLRGGLGDGHYGGVTSGGTPSSVGGNGGGPGGGQGIRGDAGPGRLPGAGGGGSGNGRTGAGATGIVIVRW